MALENPISMATILLLLYLRSEAGTEEISILQDALVDFVGFVSITLLTCTLAASCRSLRSRLCEPQIPRSCDSSPLP
jgi:hypothetical protein